MRYVYKPLDLEARTDGNRLTLQLADPGWLRSRHVDDLLPDHGHLMHLFVLSLEFVPNDRLKPYRSQRTETRPMHEKLIIIMLSTLFARFRPP